MAFPPAATPDAATPFSPAKSAAPQAGTPPPLPRDHYEKLVEALAIKAGLDPRLALSVTEVESHFDPAAVSPKGARGLMQLMPDTARRLGVRNIDDPLENARGGIAELKRLTQLHGGDLKMAARRYVASPAAPVTDTDFYVKKVFDVYRRRAGLPAAQPGEDTDGRTAVEPRLSETPSPLQSAVEGVKQSFNPTTREGRRNLAVTAGGIGVGAATSGLGLGPLAAFGASAATAGSVGAAEEAGEQIYEQARRPPAQPGEATPPPTLDYDAIMGAGTEQAALDVGGHALLTPPRFLGRWFGGPSIANQAKDLFAAERTRDLGTLQKERDTLGFKKRQIGFNSAEESQRARAAAALKQGTIEGDRNVAITAAQRRIDALLDTAKEARRMSVADAEEQATQGTARAGAEGEAAERQLMEQYQAALRPPSESAAGQRVRAVFEGPAKAQLDRYGEAVEAAKASGPPQRMKAIQAEARRLVRQILRTERAVPRTVPNPKADPRKLDPQLQIAITQAEREAITKHPLMPVLDRILNAKPALKFKDLADFETQLGRAVDFNSPVAQEMDAAGKRMWGVIRKQLGKTHPEYDQAATVYSAFRKRFGEEGFGDTVGKSGFEPGKIIQAITPNNPQQTATLMATLTAHGPDAARSVREAWLHRNVVSGGLDGLKQRLADLNTNPEFKAALFGNDPKFRVVFRELEKAASAWEEAGAKKVGSVAQAKTAGRAGVEAAQHQGAIDIAATRKTGDAELDAVTQKFQAALDAHAQATRATRDQRATAVRTQRKAIDDRLQSIGIEKRQLQKIGDEEALAILRADNPARTMMNAMFAGLRPTSFHGAVGLTSLLAGPRSGELLRLAAARPELNKVLIDWLANPNARVAYQVLKKVVGTSVGSVVDPELKAHAEAAIKTGREDWRRQSIARPGAAGPPWVNATMPPPKPPPQTPPAKKGK